MTLRQRLWCSAAAAPLSAALTVAVGLYREPLIAPSELAGRALAAGSLAVIAAFLVLSVRDLRS